MNTIPNLKCGDQLLITGFKATTNLTYRSKLLAMGLIPGTSFTVSRIAPLGDPIEIKVRGYALSLRKNEVAILKTEYLPHDIT